MYGVLLDEIPICCYDYTKLRQSSEHMYIYLGIDLDDPLLCFENWEKGND